MEKIVINGTGMSQVCISTTPTKDATTVQIPVSNCKTQAVPVVLLPGFMGSPLLATGENKKIMGDWAWFPDDPMGWVAGKEFTYNLFEGFLHSKDDPHYAGLTPEKRKELLDPANTRPLTPYDRMISPQVVEKMAKSLTEHTRRYQHITYEKNTLLSVQEALRRGWGTLAWTHYDELLPTLERKLRYLTHAQSANQAANSQELREAYSELYAFLARDKTKTSHAHLLWEQDRLEKALPYHYPVFAVGYNWLQSCAVSAEYVAQRIQGIIDYVQKPARVVQDSDDHSPPQEDGYGLGLECQQGVILLTHSMGGLVARVLAKNHPHLVKGSIHMAQPCNGTGTMYKRIVTGWEGDAGPYLAKDDSELTPIAAQSPGAMELAPNQFYGAGWLKMVDQRGNTIKAFPSLQSNGKSDPYNEIYLNENTWWQMINPEKIAPELIEANKIKAEWRKYAQIAQRAKAFHQELNQTFSPHTYLIYAKGPYATWGQVDWELRLYERTTTDSQRPGERELREQATPSQIFEAQTSSTDGTKKRLNLPDQEGVQSGRLRYMEARLQRGETLGDDTVPYFSANGGMSSRSSETVDYAFEFDNAAMRSTSGFSHTGVVSNWVVNSIVLACVVNIVAD